LVHSKLENGQLHHRQLGVWAGTSITGTGTVTVINGAFDFTNGAAQNGQAHAATAFGDLAELSGAQPLTGDLGGQTLTPGTSGVGVYSIGAAQLTGTLYLNFEGESDQDIVIQIASTLTTESGSSVDIEGAGTDEGASEGDHVYWEVGSSATLGTTTVFVGDIIANTSISLDTGATITCGDAMALNGGVTMEGNTISTCSGGTGTGGAVTNYPTPEPGTFWLLVTGILGAAGAIRRRFTV
jgi:type VI secretion system secreted protein VgrG